MLLKISEIRIHAERREARADDVREIADSISDVGLLNPITVDSGYILIAGLHRLEAVKLLGWTEIECTVCGLEGLQAELAELDENFVRADLSPIDCQRRCDFEIFRRIGNVIKWRAKVYSP